MLIRNLFSLVILCCFISSASLAQYEIKGKINLSEDWQQQIFLATVNKLDNYHSANPKDIIQVAFINEDGSFSLKGDNLPDDDRFYRLYLIKEENTEFDACLYVGGDDHNFIHLVLNNQSQVEVISDPNRYAPFGNYKIKGDPANQSLCTLEHLIYPSFYFYQIKFPSELQFSQEKLNRDLFTFADTCSHTMVALAAIINTDFDNNFTDMESTYLRFGERMDEGMKHHSYTNDYHRKMRYYQDDSRPESSENHWIIGLLSALLLALSAFVIRQKIELNTLKEQNLSEANPKLNFTNQEERILKLIVDGQTNKEIASELFIELSTVKTHINKIYAKLGVKSRNEAKSAALRHFGLDPNPVIHRKPTPKYWQSLLAPNIFTSYYLTAQRA